LRARPASSRILRSRYASEGEYSLGEHVLSKHLGVTVEEYRELVEKKVTGEELDFD
jgi:hypothetical protein